VKVNLQANKNQNLKGVVSVNHPTGTEKEKGGKVDTSETYIKMCDCPEIQRQGTRPRNLIDNSDYASILIGDGSYNNPFHRVWLPRQDQLQEMLLKYWWSDEQPGNNISVMLQKFDWWLNDTCPKYQAMEQLWLAFVMKEKHNKIWDGERWS